LSNHFDLALTGQADDRHNHFPLEETRDGGMGLGLISFPRFQNYRLVSPAYPLFPLHSLFIGAAIFMLTILDAPMRRPLISSWEMQNNGDTAGFSKLVTCAMLI
jgi:hypothetical protein